MFKRGGYRVPQDAWPKRLKDFDDRGAALRVRLRREATLRSMIMPAGTIGTVRAGSRWDRLDFIANPCSHCGVQMRLSAPVTSFDLIDAQGNPLP